MDSFEKYYGKVFRTFLWVLNPFKKKVIRTECQVHRFINNKAVKLLNKYNYYKEYDFYNFYLEELNRGVFWADQDFKSINHFYSPSRKRGLFGHSNALALTQKYYEKAKQCWEKGNINNCVFYLGACVHLIQDMTIPQHVNIRLLDSHRRYENFVKATYDVVEEYTSNEKPIVFHDLSQYIKYNSEKALEIYYESRDIINNKERFHSVTSHILPLAQRTTAGCLIMFLKDVDFSDGESI